MGFSIKDRERKRISEFQRIVRNDVSGGISFHKRNCFGIADGLLDPRYYVFVPYSLSSIDNRKTTKLAGADIIFHTSTINVYIPV